MIRRHLVFLMGLVALCGNLVAIFWIGTERHQQLRGYENPSVNLALPFKNPLFGVNADLLNLSADQLDAQLEDMNMMGVSWIRQFAYWDEIEAERNIFNWDAWDQLLASVAEYPEMVMVVVFMNSPEWARTTEIVSAPPDNPAEMAPFVENFVGRYGDVVDYYQIWDEPNLFDAWGQQNPSVTDYAHLLAITYRAIHRLDSDATVILGALAPTLDDSGRNIPDVQYLEDLYVIGSAEFFDAVAGKPYGFNHSPDDLAHVSILNFRRLALLREIMVHHGDANKALWASQWGWNSLPDGWVGDESIWGQVSAEDQILYTLDAIALAEREWSWLGGLIIHHWQPSVDDANAQWGFSLLNPDDQLTALGEAIAERERVNIARNGLYPARNLFARYSGLWTFGELGADIGWLETSDSQLAFDFYGTDVSLVVREGNYFAFLYPTIDGETDFVNALPEDANGNPYLLLRSPDLRPNIRIVPIAQDLPLGQHTLNVVADRGWDQWALVGYAVSDGNLDAPYQRLMAVTIGSAFVALLVVILGGFQVAQIYHRLLLRLLAIVQVPLQFALTLITSLALMASMLLTWQYPEAHVLRRVPLEQFLLVVISGGVLVFELPFIVVLICILVLFVLILRHIEWGLFLIVLYAPFFLYPVKLYQYALPMSEMLLIITFGAWIIKGLARYHHTTPQFRLSELTMIDWCAIGWIILGTIALVGSEFLDPALTDYRTIIIEPVLFYLMLRTTHISRWADKLILSLILAGVLVSIIGLAQIAVGFGVITAEDGAIRLASVYGSPNNVGLLLDRIIPFVFVMLLLATEKRWLWGIVTSLLCLVALLTQSVGAIVIGIPVGLVMVVLLVYRKKAVIPLVVMVVIGAIGFTVLVQTSARFAGAFSLDRGTNFTRLRVWESALEIVQDHPMMGLGLDQFLYAFRSEYIRPDAIQDPDLSHPHQIVLDFWIRFGFGGVILLGISQVAFWQTMVNLYRHEQTPVVIGAMGAMAGLVAHGMIDNSIFVLDLAIIYWLLMALPFLVMVERRESGEKTAY